MQPEASLEERVARADAESVGAGLDALDTPLSERATGPAAVAKRLAARVLPPVVAIALMIGIWQALWAAAIWEEYKLPAPSAVWANIWSLVTTGKIVDLFWVSVHRAVIGFAISLVIAVPLGLAIANLKVVRRGI